MQYNVDKQGNIYLGDTALGDRLATQAEIDAHDLTQARAAKIAEMSAMCKSVAEADYIVANPLGTGVAYTYPNKWQYDQVNLIGQCCAAIDNPAGTFYFKCKNNTTGVWADVAHTSAQIRAVGQISRAQVEAAKVRNTQRYDAIMAATTVAAINAVVW